MLNLMIKNLNYEACVDSKYDLILALNCFKEVSSFKVLITFHQHIYCCLQFFFLLYYSPTRAFPR